MGTQRLNRIGIVLSVIVLAALVLAGAGWAQPGDLVYRQGFEPRDRPGDAGDAAAFLQRATFGATAAEVARVQAIGFGAWIDEQMALPATWHQPQLAAYAQLGQGQRQLVWWATAFSAPDQLRQRMAFALSQILVVSDLNGDLEGQPLALAAYYDLLLQHAFGNYRDLLEQVTLTPVMGHYLSMFRSTRDLVAGIEPDENYAREIMQLFSIGLIELNPDGTPRLDGLGQTIPTYDQTHIVGLAEAFTGWNFAGADGGDGDCEPWEWRWPESNWLAPLAPCPVTDPNEGQPADYHVTAAKTIVGNVVLPAGQTARQDLTMALDTLFAHPNVGPFLSYRLIQRLVKSNPSPAYVARVATVFDDNGAGVRGDLGATLRAILTDHEALDLYQTGGHGKLREPLLQLTQFYRVYQATINPAFVADPDCCWPGALYQPEAWFGQGALRSPSVFNFFKPDYAQPGPIENSGLVSPEFQIATETQVVNIANLYFAMLIWSPPPDYPWMTQYRIQIDGLRALAGDSNALVDRIDSDLFYRRMDPLARQIIVNRIDQIPSGNIDQRVGEALYYALTSPQAMVQR